VSAVRLEALRVMAGERALLDSVSLNVGQGEHLLVVGPSGSGKTTLLRAIAGLAVPTSGRVELFGVCASEGPKMLLPTERRRIGFLFQNGALWPHMSAARQLDFVLEHAGVAKHERDRRASELLDWVELPGFEGRMPSTLSGGEAQRVALARALAIGPKLLLLDEPLGPLDYELRSGLLAKLGELQRKLGLTVIHVTHAPDEAREIATRTVRLRAGRIEETA
jgi:ABC-type Fe3+/spermidine/putrescine transport system ATPase subunit